MRALLHRLPFALAITLVLVLKVALLYLLYKAFFAAPQVKKMRMPTAQVEQHLLNRPARASQHVLPPSKDKP
jgi:membrane protein implicated in regulation of membrane protease activity